MSTKTMKQNLPRRIKFDKLKNKPKVIKEENNAKNVQQFTQIPIQQPQRDQNILEKIINNENIFHQRLTEVFSFIQILFRNYDDTKENELNNNFLKDFHTAINTYIQYRNDACNKELKKNITDEELNNRILNTREIDLDNEGKFRQYVITLIHNLKNKQIENTIDKINNIDATKKILSLKSKQNQNLNSLLKEFINIRKIITENDYKLIEYAIDYILTNFFIWNHNAYEFLEANILKQMQTRENNEIKSEKIRKQLDNAYKEFINKNNKLIPLKNTPFSVFKFKTNETDTSFFSENN